MQNLNGIGYFYWIMSVANKIELVFFRLHKLPEFEKQFLMLMWVTFFVGKRKNKFYVFSKKKKTNVYISFFKRKNRF
jgi:hypothetical protein